MFTAMPFGTGDDASHATFRFPDVISIPERTVRKSMMQTVRDFIPHRDQPVDPDAEDVTSVRQGDIAAFACLYYAHVAKINSVAESMLDTRHRRWGSEPYTDDSSIYMAAVDAGLISFEEGGPVTIQITPGLNECAGTLRNGVESARYGKRLGSFRFVR